MLLERDFPPDLRVEKEMQSLIEAGHQITLACFTFRKKKEIEKNAALTIIRFPISKLIYKSSVAALKFPFYFDFWRRNLNRLLRQKSFDVVHVHDLPLAKIGSEIQKNFNIPFVLDLHENWPALLKISQHTNTLLGKLLSSQEQWEEFEKDSINQADRVIVVVQEMKARLIKKGFSEDKIAVISNTPAKIDLPDLPPENRFTLIYAGGIDEQRGLQIALQAVKSVITIIPDLKFLIIGEGRYRRVLKQKTTEYNLTNNVVFTGWLGFDEMVGYLAGSHLALIPHLRNDHTDTTIPHKLFQYFAAGKPVIASDCTPLKRIILETNTGLIYRDNDPEQLADAILNLAEDHQLYSEIRENQKKALETYNWSEDAVRLCHVYRDLNNA